MKTTIKTSQGLLVLAALALLLSVNSTRAQGTAFTYQGRLTASGGPADGSYDFRFRLAADVLGNNSVGGTLFTNGVPVNNGLFTVQLDFGASFPGAHRWLEIAVRTNGGDGYTLLTPLQSLKPTPYAITASNLTGALPATQLIGTLASAQLGGTYSGAVTFDNASSSFAGNGAELTSLDASSLSSGMVPDARLAANVARTQQVWLLNGNTGTSASENFLGTTDNQPLELRVNGARALRLEPDETGERGIANIIGGSSANYVGAGVKGATIAGGGNLAGPNRIEADYSGVGGGLANTVLTGAVFSTIGGGLGNTIKLDAIIATIAGGTAHTIEERAYDATIGGGFLNTIQSGCQQATIGGGGNNTINAGAYWATISGGWNNAIETNAGGALIAGGYGNTIKANGRSAFIGGGAQNTIQTGAGYASVGGGWRNSIEASSGTIAGGTFNLLGSNAYAGVVAGGTVNTNAGNTSTIGGGHHNFVENNANGAAIGGGSGNTILANSHASAIGGGASNTNSAPFATVPGGAENFAAGLASLAAGYRAKANHDGAFVWADSNPANFDSTAANEFSIRATGGARIVTAISNVNGTPIAGVVLAPGSGTWSSLSDRNAKANVAIVDRREILRRLAAVPVATWNYQSQPASVRHIGPMSQDFKAAFGVGENDTTITTVDADGVALAAIQGLHEIVLEKDAEIQTLKRRLDQMEQAITRLVPLEE